MNKVTIIFWLLVFPYPVYRLVKIMKEGHKYTLDKIEKEEGFRRDYIALRDFERFQNDPKSKKYQKQAFKWWLILVGILLGGAFIEVLFW